LEDRGSNYLGHVHIGQDLLNRHADKHLDFGEQSDQEQRPPLTGRLGS
jgi:hypothetical protein